MDKPPDKYRRQIAEAWSELANAEALRKAADQRVEDCRDLIRANANFLPEIERWTELMLLEMVKRPTNISEAVRFTLFFARARNERLTATQIKENIEERGFRLADYTNPLASIHTILRRMKESDQPEVDYDEETETYLATEFPLNNMWGEQFHQKIRKNVLMRLVKYDADEVSEATQEEVDEFFKKTIDRKRVEED